MRPETLHDFNPIHETHVCQPSSTADSSPGQPAASSTPDVRWRFKIGECIAKHTKCPLTPTRSPAPAPPGPGGLQVLPSYSRYAINYSIEHFAGYYGLYFGPSSVGQCKHRQWFSGGNRSCPLAI